MARAYACLANGGILYDKLALTKDDPVNARRVLEPGAVFLISDILSDREARMISFGPDNLLNFPFPVAVKTGTTKDFRDNWTAGYTPEITVVVWVGNHNQREMKNSSGITGAGPIFRAVMLKAMENRPKRTFAPPEPVKSVQICAHSGLLPGQHCPQLRDEYVTEANQPTKKCTYHQRKDKRIIPIYPRLYKDWLKQNVHTPYLLEKPVAARVSKNLLAITYPPDNTVLAMDPIIAQQDQRIPLRINQTDIEQIQWFVDNEPLVLARDKRAYWPLRRGRHIIVAKTKDQTATANIVVY
jgi:penicillin-binding protein 1C